jgi:hypothetical protein
LLEPVERYTREFEPVPVKNNDTDMLDERTFESYVAAIRRLKSVSRGKWSIPVHALDVLDQSGIRLALTLKKTGRFRTLPQQLVMTALRNAIEFSIEYGDYLIEGYLNLAARANQAGESCATYSHRRSIQDCLPQKLWELGVKQWSIDPHQKRQVKNYVRARGKAYFVALRANIGLWELLRVLYGAAHIGVGTLGARRAGEHSDLIAGECLDRTNTRLVFRNRKSGIMDCRELEARPIPPVAVKMIQQLERISGGLKAAGLIEGRTPLFCYPRQNKIAMISDPDSMRLDSSIDLFCDYFETARNRDGLRYYFRQHQLRRFFAMLFYWGGTFGGAEALRWFLAQTDARHLYRYVTENTPGEVLVAIKANFAGEQVRSGDASARALADLLSVKFGTGDFLVLAAEELDEYIEELLISKTLTVEPIFFDTPSGQMYRIAIILEPTRSTHVSGS